MFGGFTDKTFEFFMAISFNNNREFFHENHSWYVDSVRDPLRELAFELADTIEEIDPDLERRPEKTVSRLNRDLRFTNDKSPYRDYMWIGFDQMRENRHAYPGFYVAVDARQVSLGMGFYEENRPLMNAHRSMLQKNPCAMDDMVRALGGDYCMNARVFKRMEIPEGLSELTKPWYPIRAFDLSRNIDDDKLIQSPELVPFLKRELLRLKDLYRYFADLTPQE